MCQALSQIMTGTRHHLSGLAAGLRLFSNSLTYTAYGFRYVDGIPPFDHPALLGVQFWPFQNADSMIDEGAEVAVAQL